MIRKAMLAVLLTCTAGTVLAQEGGAGGPPPNPYASLQDHPSCTRDELQQLPAADTATQVMSRADEGLPKLWTIHQALLLRREHPEWFGADAAYTPLLAEGSKAEHLIACMRGNSVIAIVPRLLIRLDGAWRRTRLTLPEGRWKNLLTRAVIEGGSVEVEKLLRDFPVALLVRDEQSHA